MSRPIERDAASPAAAVRRRAWIPVAAPLIGAYVDRFERDFADVDYVCDTGIELR